eukprot:TRINITY_DN3815_c0_g1_i1.p1 TRINITY_DN3815_c0_g1~~TRINITY_DN3815_c0_g1_i1.p1  ORF type:complete len:425 (-),score=73.85 TRINITY_DN3815_c0_g1_i1:51-1325(-)
MSIAMSPSAGSLRASIQTVAIDEDDYLDDIKNTRSAGFPYKKVGIVFVVFAIIAGVLLCIIPYSVAKATGLTIPEEGRIFYGIVGVFILCLFSCLYCTYYLGGSRDSWEIPEMIQLRFTFTNFITFVGMVIEFVQICSFAFNTGTNFTGSSSLARMTYIAVPFQNGRVFEIMYWIMFCIAFSPYIFVISVRVVIYAITRARGEAKAAEYVQRHQQGIYAFLWFLVNTLYLPVITTIMGGLDCTFTPTGVTMDEVPSVTCLASEHYRYLVCSLIAFVIYYPAASFAQAQTQNISDIKFKPKISFIFVQGKVILAAMYIFFSTYAGVYLGVTLGVEVLFLIINIVFSPCLVEWMNRLRTIFFAISAWTTVCALVSLTSGLHPNVPLILLIIGWVVAGLGIPLVYFLAGRIVSSSAEKKAIRLDSTV